MSLIEIKNLRKEYPNVTPLENINANVESGEVISIIGPSGVGKSTLLRCINRLETPTSGSILVDGIDVCSSNTNLSSVRRKMGMVFQSFNLFGHKLVIENVMMAQQDLLGLSAQDAYSEAMRQLDRVGLVNKARNYPHELSGGQQQRVAIARALAMHPQIVLFDEPTSALDPSMISEVLGVIRSLAGTGLTMLVVTHEMRLARDVSDRIWYLDKGIIYEEGTPQQILIQPKRQLTRDFVFRIRRWEWNLQSDGLDLYGMTGSLKAFGVNQFINQDTVDICQKVIEALVIDILVPVISDSHNPEIILRLDAEEEGKKIILEVAYPEFVKKDDLCNKLNNLLEAHMLHETLEQIQSNLPNTMRFAIKIQ